MGVELFSSLNVLRLAFGVPSVPSVPIKFCTLPHIEAVRYSSVLLVTEKRKIAVGIALRSASAGIKGLNAWRVTSTGIALSERSTCPKGYAARKAQSWKRGRPALGTRQPSAPS